MKYDFEGRSARESNAPPFSLEDRASIVDGLKNDPDGAIAAAILVTTGTKFEDRKTKAFLYHLSDIFRVKLPSKHVAVVMMGFNWVASYCSDNFLPQKSNDERAEYFLSILRACAGEVFAWRRAQ